MDLFGHEDPEEYAERRHRELYGNGKMETYPSHEALAKAIRSCSRCPLRKEGGLGPVLSTGPSDSPLMIVGEGPGGVEDDYGGPLVGPSGQLLDKALLSVGITRDHVYVTNIVKCRPRGNRTPTMEEGRFCGSIWLAAEIALVKPKVIVGLGKVALRFFLGREAGIIRSRGHWIDYHGIPVMPTFHPAYLLRQSGRSLVDAKWQVYYDLLAAKEKAASLAPKWVLIKRIILAAALCAALGTCGFTEVSAAEETNGNEEITVIKGKILRTETVKRADKHSKAQKAEKKEKAAVKKEQKALLSKEKAKTAEPEKTVKAAKQEPAVDKAAETAPKDAEAVKKAPEKPRFEDKRIEINLASRLLTLYQGDVGIRMYPIAPGKPSSPTPTGRRTVVDMEVNPTWIDPDSGTTIPSGPDCPIGYRWIGIGGNYGIHGTNVPSAIGTYASHGCVRMNEADVEDLYAHIVKGIPVDILYERVVVQREADHTVVYYIYPDGYGKEPLDVSKVKAKLAPFGVASCVSDDDIKQAIEASDGNPRYVAKVYDIYLDGRKLDARAFGKDGHIYLPVMPLARAAGIKADWSSNWNQIRTPYGSAKAILKNRSLLIDAADAPALLHLTGSLDKDYNYQMK